MVEVLVVGATADSPPPGLTDADPRVRIGFAMTKADLDARLPGAEVLLLWADRTAWLRAAWPRAARLRWIQAVGVGVDRILFPELVESEVMVTNCRGVFDQTMTEYMAALMLAMAKDLPATLDAQRDHRWHYRPVAGLAGRRLVILGVGSIGRAIGRMARGFGMAVVGVGRSGRPGDDVFEQIVASADLARAAADADWLVIAAPLTAATRGMVDRHVLAALPPHARLINVGRGAIVDEDALVEAVRLGRLAGAALDVFAEEPLPDDHPLWDLPNVIISPHMASDIVGFERWFVDVFTANLERYLKGEPLSNVVDKQLGFPPSLAPTVAR